MSCVRNAGVRSALRTTQASMKAEAAPTFGNRNTLELEMALTHSPQAQTPSKANKIRAWRKETSLKQSQKK